MRRIVEACVDSGTFFETGRQWGRGLITGFARIDGYSVAVLAGDPHFMGGAWTADVCRKLIKHVDLAQTFHLPVVHFVDCPGFAVGVKHERAATVKLGVQAMAAVYQARVPWCSIVVRQAFGLAGSAMMNPTRTKLRYCWPSGDWGSLPLEGGIEAAFKAELEAHPDPETRLAEIRAWGRSAPLPLPHRGELLCRRNHRSARHPQTALRLGQPRAARRRDWDLAVSACGPDGAQNDQCVSSCEIVLERP